MAEGTKHRRLNGDSDAPLTESLEQAMEKNLPVGAQDYGVHMHGNQKIGHEERIKAIVEYIRTGGNSTKAGAKVGASRHLVQKWQRYAPWWPEYLNHARKILQEELDAELSNIVHGATEQLRDRLEKGDKVRGKRVPLKADTLIKMIDILFRDRALIRGDPTANIQRASTDKQLEQIRKTFVDWAQKAQTGVVVEAEVIDQPTGWEERSDDGEAEPQDSSSFAAPGAAGEEQDPGSPSTGDSGTH